MDITAHYSPREASRRLTDLGLPVAETTLAKLRCVGGGPAFVRFGRRRICYPETSLTEWAKGKLSREMATTSGAAA